MWSASLAVKRALESVFGPLDVQPLSSQIWGLYTGLVYFTPIFGGLLADRVLGQRRTVIIGAVLDGDRPFHDGGRAAFSVRAARADSRPRLLQAEHFDPGRRALRARRSIAATAPIPSSMSASMSARSWRRWSAARSARKWAGTTALPPPASACASGCRFIFTRCRICRRTNCTRRRRRISNIARSAAPNGARSPRCLSVRAQYIVLGVLRADRQHHDLVDRRTTSTAPSVSSDRPREFRRPGFSPSIRS